MSSGHTSCVWFVSNFLEPLAAQHTIAESSSIERINCNIQKSVSSCCASCKLPLDPTATQPKDQEMTCNKCGNMFHKKCNNRKKTTGNWRRSPWYCSDCIIQLDCTSDQNLDFDNGTRTTSDQQGEVQLCLNTEESHAPISSTIEYSTDESPSTQLPHVQPNTDYTVNTSDNQVLAVSNRDNYHSSQQRQPSNASRQRSTNLNLVNPEMEFQKTALSACRSTIAQQESELKRLKETLDIRNKRITQLEQVVTHASESISTRGSDLATELSGNKLEILINKFEEISRKINDTTSTTPSNSIIINGCQPICRPQLNEASTQTPPETWPEEAESVTHGQDQVICTQGEAT